MGHEEHGGTWHMDAAQLDTQRKKGEAILKTSSTVYSTNRSKLQLDRAEKSKSNPKNENADLGEPECYDFEEYEAPRMNPSVVAAHKRIGLLQRKFWFFKQEEEVQAPTPRSRSLLTTPRRLPAQEPHRASSFEPREGEDNSQRRRKSSKARRSSSNSIESKQRKLNSIAEGRVDLEEPLFENRDSSTINAVPGLLSDPGPLQPFEQASSTKAKEPHTFNDEEEEEEEPQARSSEPNPVEWSAPDGRLPSPDHDLVSQFFGGH
ncbi:unnamed protein product [Microthlaspi erraticum]|uniref:Uncharacterized protein n=1 Tax=Microthlaspi erraticum TaxID=1685480 RepID=A0A6D2KFK0_9BRAS|nr:unnamed protein product [Microthlaspi erraticum]